MKNKNKIKKALENYSKQNTAKVIADISSLCRFCIDGNVSPAISGKLIMLYKAISEHSLNGDSTGMALFQKAVDEFRGYLEGKKK